jgi:hypothetical protein
MIPTWLIEELKRRPEQREEWNRPRPRLEIPLPAEAEPDSGAPSREPIVIEL